MSINKFPQRKFYYLVPKEKLTIFLYASKLVVENRQNENAVIVDVVRLIIVTLIVRT